MMEECVVAFIDLLGFRSIIKGGNDQRQQEILMLLQSLAEASGEFKLDTIYEDDNRREISLKPAISSFSDCVVFSFPIKICASEFQTRPLAPVIHYLAHDIARIFSRAIKFGCLVRGAVTIGQLHHSNGVVFGSALVDAYEHETKYARFPRVILSERAAERIGEAYFLKVDSDGFTYIDFVEASYQQARGDRGWIGSVRDRCRMEIETLSKCENAAGLQYWRWFQNFFEHLVISHS